MVALVGIVSRCSLTIETCHKNQSNKSKLALYKALLHFYNHLKQLYISKKWSTLVVKVGVVCVDIHILRHLKQELVWATHKPLQVISNIMLIKTIIPLRN